MAGESVNGSGNGARSGAQALLLLAAPLNCLILRALSEGARQQSDLRSVVGQPAQTTLRARLDRLTGIGVVEKRRRNRFPGVLECELTRSGRELLSVVGVLETWLEAAPRGPIRLPDDDARAAIRALVEGWSTTIVRALAASPLSLTQLDGVIATLSYPALERRLAAMRLAGLVEPCTGDGRGTPHTVTDWLREGMAPLMAATRWEHRHLAQAAPTLARLDLEAAFLLTAPLAHLPAETSGVCRMASELGNGGGHELAGVTIDVRNGRVASCVTELGAEADAWAHGSPAAWFEAVIDGDCGQLKLGGDCRLARASVDALGAALFARAAQPEAS